MRFLVPALLLIGLAPAAAGGAAGLKIGLAAPLSGPSALLGAQMRQGAEAAAGAAGNSSVVLDTVDDLCTAAGGEAAARHFVEINADIALGFLCIEAINAAMPVLKEAGIPTVAIGVRADSLTDEREKNAWPVFRLGPRGDGEARAIAEILTKLWADEVFAILDDGTIYGRELSESFRAAAEQAGLKPVLVDTFRPGSDNQTALAERLRQAGATHVFVGGDRSDVAILGRDAASLGYGLTIAGGESLRAAPEDVELQPGTLMIGLPEPADKADGALVARLREAGLEPEGYVLPTYAGVEVAAKAALEAHEANTKVSVALSNGVFQTAIGPVRFDGKGDLADNPFGLFRFDGQNFLKAE